MYLHILQSFLWFAISGRVALQEKDNVEVRFDLGGLLRMWRFGGCPTAI